MQSIMHPRRSVCVSCIRNNQNKEALHREVPEPSEDDLTNLIHRKDSTASGDRLRDSKDSKTIPQVSQDTGFSTEVVIGQYSVTQQSRFKISMCHEFGRITFF